MSRDLIIAASRGLPGTVCELLPHASAAAKSHALFLASLHGHRRAQNILLEADVPRQTHYDGLVCRAAGKGDVNGLLEAVKRGGDIHTNNDMALRLAALNGHVSATKELLARGANPHRAFTVEDLFGEDVSLSERGALAEVRREFIEKHETAYKPGIGFQFTPQS